MNTEDDDDTPAVIASEAKQSISPRVKKEAVDCFASPAMTIAIVFAR